MKTRTAKVPHGPTDRPTDRPTSPKRKLRLYFVRIRDDEIRLVPVCRVKHGGTLSRRGACKRPHAVPKTAAWSGECDRAFVSDLRESFRESRKTYRRSLRRWQRKLAQMNKIKPLSVVAEFHRQMIADHVKTKPTFVMAIDPKRLTEPVK